MAFVKEDKFTSKEMYLYTKRLEIFKLKYKAQTVADGWHDKQD